MKKILYVLMFTLLGITTAYAQTKEKPWNLGLYYGRSEYDGDLGSGFFKFNKAFYGYGQLSMSRYLNSWFNLAINGSYGGHGFYEKSDQNSIRFGAHKIYGDFQVQFNFIEKESALFRPYIFAGIGMRYMSEITGSELVPPPITEPGYDLVIPAGIGINFRIYKNISIRYIMTVGWTNHDNRDTKVAGTNNDWQLDQSLGFTFNLGPSSKDSDGDGVVDKKDKCPDTPAGALVDADGCTVVVDRDGDGVPDKDDLCPDQPGSKLTQGCPDKDGDGVMDSKDECPDVPGPALTNGCPDRDGDGVPDYKDNCPDVAGLAQYGGCPFLDTDGDGVKDSEDHCPTLAGPPENFGCPWTDSDGDGVPDKDDKCPLTPGDPANFGCPVIKAEEAAVIKTAFENLEFETAKAVIRSSSFASMDELAALLKSKPAWKLKISGHTDNVGTDAYNMTLSKNRAQSTANYLTGKGVPQSQLIVEWFGETMPIADNNTPEGRQTNRRVEMQVVFN
jgi:outer membrane protein OmpA-like peptidoglycan-associated protein